MQTNKLIENWDEIILAWYEDSDIETEMTLEATNEEWRKCFIEYKTEMLEDYTEVLEWYGDTDEDINMQKLDAINEEWRNCFMIDYKTETILPRAA